MQPRGCKSTETDHVVLQIGYDTGTAWIKESEDEIDRKAVDAFKDALALGYRHLDCAQCELVWSRD